jgi:restriction endonuclease XhoI-like protein
MGIEFTDFEKHARRAVKTFWANRLAAKKKQADRGVADQGERAGVTAGRNMDGFVDLATKVVRANGLSDAEICLKRRVLTLPGYFRPTKLWDMLVVSSGRLVAAIEFKSHVGPSFGNNFNNRTEEAIGNALDLWTAYREGAFGDDSPQPFVGWLMLLEDSEKSRSPIKDAEPHFPVFSEFSGASYAHRYGQLCRKLVQEQLCTAACVLVSPRTAARTGKYSEISDVSGLREFVTQLAGYIVTETARIQSKP